MGTHAWFSWGKQPTTKKDFFLNLQTFYRYDPEIQLGSSHDPFLQAEICLMEAAAQESVAAAAAAAKLLQSCPTLCDPIDGSPPGSAIPGILQARTLESVAISFSSA